MSEWTTQVIWTAVRVTLIALVAVVTYRLAARRGPRAAVVMSLLAFAAIVGITALGFVPWPGDWISRWQTAVPNTLDASRKTTDDVPSPSDCAVVAAAPEASRRFNLFWRTVSDGIRRLHELQLERRHAWPDAIAAVLCTGVLLAMVFMITGLFAVYRLRERGRIVREPGARRLLDALAAAMCIRQHVELRETSELAGAATLGWRRPVVLLPHDWRTWRYVELQSVLAHELAHIRHRDYLATLLVRTAVALHVYHPLMHWLAGRLRLQQELAADAEAARFAGGRQLYMKALARLALRQDAPVTSWPVRAFLPAPGTLMRRIQMLQMNHVRSNRWLGRYLPAALLFAAVLGVGLIGGPSAGRKATASEGQNATAAKLPAFDLSYVAPDALGVIAFRPAAAFQLPELKRYTALVDAFIAANAKQLGVQSDFPISVTDVEQVVGCHRVIHNANFPEGQRRAVVTDVSMIRMVKPYDWKKQLEELGASLMEFPCDGGRYYKVSKLLPTPLLAPSGLFLYIPDDRTLVINTEENIKTFVEAKKLTLPACVWMEGWRRVEHDLFAVAFDTRDERISEITEKEKTINETYELWIELLMKNAKQVVFGTGTGEAIRLSAFGRCESDASAKTSVALTSALIEKGREQIQNAKPTNDSAKKMISILAEMLENTKVERRGSEVHWTVTSKETLSELLTNSVSAELASEK